MKQKDKILSSLLIAFVAGFIYYAFADYDNFIRIPQLAYETIKSAVVNTPSEDAKSEITGNNITGEQNEGQTDIVSVKSTASSVAFEDGIFAHIPDLSNYIRIGDFGGHVYINEEKLKELEDIQDFGFNTEFGEGMMALANYDEMDMPLDTNDLKVRIKIRNLDSLNFYLDNSMMKLNESLSKLTEQLRSEDFLNNVPEIDMNDIEVEIDMDDLKETIKESMNEFDENMKEFNYDMKEFKDSMKDFKESMKELKKNLKDLDSTKTKKFIKKIEIIES
ncbi:MAG: hypothetical protein NTY74_08365 [Ignavibacteriae bacterium]|nr:hypothetical protein [Ignavibacteriota bacterium]